MSIDKYAQKEIELVARLRTANERVASVEAAAGSAFLDAEESTDSGETSSVAVEVLMKARAEVSAIAAAIKTCRGRRLEAVAAKRRSTAAEMRKQVAELTSQLERLEAKTQKHIVAISELQGMPFTAAPTPTVPGIPLSQQLQNQITTLAQRAANLEGSVPRHGHVHLDNVASSQELIDAVLRTEADGPDAATINAWASACEAQNGRAFGEQNRIFRLYWKDGSIDFGASYIQIPDLARTSAGAQPGHVVTELGTDVFRAAAVA